MKEDLEEANISAGNPPLIGTKRSAMQLISSPKLPKRISASNKAQGIGLALLMQ